MSLTFEAWQQRERTLVVPPVTTQEPFTGELLEYLRSKDDGFLRAFIIHFAYDRRHQVHRHNPWVLWFVDHNGHQLPGKMPLWCLERFAKRPFEWTPIPPAQGELF